MVAEDIWIEYTDKKGNVNVQYHRVWDKNRFIENQRETCIKEGVIIRQVLKP